MSKWLYAGGFSLLILFVSVASDNLEYSLVLFVIGIMGFIFFMRRWLDDKMSGKKEYKITTSDGSKVVITRQMNSRSIFRCPVCNKVHKEIHFRYHIYRRRIPALSLVFRVCFDKQQEFETLIAVFSINAHKYSVFTHGGIDLYLLDCLRKVGFSEQDLTVATKEAERLKARTKIKIPDILISLAFIILTFIATCFNNYIVVGFSFTIAVYAGWPVIKVILGIEEEEKE